MTKDLADHVLPPRVRGFTRDDHGSASSEVAILLPIALLAIAMLVIGARIAIAGQSINGVAGTAARAASLAQDPDDAMQAATSGYSTAPGTAATVTVTVGCTVDLSDIGITGLPGSRTLHDTASSPIDPARPTS